MSTATNRGLVTQANREFVLRALGITVVHSDSDSDSEGSGCKVDYGNMKLKPLREAPFQSAARETLMPMIVGYRCGGASAGTKQPFKLLYAMANGHTDEVIYVGNGSVDILGRPPPWRERVSLPTLYVAEPLGEIRGHRGDIYEYNHPVPVLAVLFDRNQGLVRFKLGFVHGMHWSEKKRAHSVRFSCAGATAGATASRTTQDIEADHVAVLVGRLPPIMMRGGKVQRTDPNEIVDLLHEVASTCYAGGNGRDQPLWLAIQALIATLLSEDESEDAANDEVDTEIYYDAHENDDSHAVEASAPMSKLDMLLSCIKGVKEAATSARGSCKTQLESVVRRLELRFLYDSISASPLLPNGAKTMVGQIPRDEEELLHFLEILRTEVGKDQSSRNGITILKGKIDAGIRIIQLPSGGGATAEVPARASRQTRTAAPHVLTGQRPARTTRASGFDGILTACVGSLYEDVRAAVEPLTHHRQGDGNPVDDEARLLDLAEKVRGKLRGLEHAQAWRPYSSDRRGAAQCLDTIVRTIDDLRSDKCRNMFPKGGDLSVRVLDHVKALKSSPKSFSCKSVACLDKIPETTTGQRAELKDDIVAAAALGDEALLGEAKKAVREQCDYTLGGETKNGSQLLEVNRHLAQEVATFSTQRRQHLRQRQLERERSGGIAMFRGRGSATGTPRVNDRCALAAEKLQEKLGIAMAARRVACAVKARQPDHQSDEGPLWETPEQLLEMVERLHMAQRGSGLDEKDYALLKNYVATKNTVRLSLTEASSADPSRWALPGFVAAVGKSAAAGLSAGRLILPFLPSTQQQQHSDIALEEILDGLGVARL